MKRPLTSLLARGALVPGVALVLGLGLLVTLPMLVVEANFRRANKTPSRR